MRGVELIGAGGGLVGALTATAVGGLAVQDTVSRPIKKSDEELQIVWGEVYAPGFPDSQNDYMTAETIRDMAYNFMRKNALDAIDTEHSRQKNGCYVVESFIAREDDSIFIPGSWVIGVKVPDPGIWEMVKSGELNGFSLDGLGVRVDGMIEVEVPETLTGQTDEGTHPTVPHRHDFWVKFDTEGRFLGGETSPGPDGHKHIIKRGTVTEDTDGHNHRFSFVEGIAHARAST